MIFDYEPSRTLLYDKENYSFTLTKDTITQETLVSEKQARKASIDFLKCILGSECKDLEVKIKDGFNKDIKDIYEDSNISIEILGTGLDKHKSTIDILKNKKKINSLDIEFIKGIAKTDLLNTLEEGEYSIDFNNELTTKERVSEFFILHKEDEFSFIVSKKEKK